MRPLEIALIIADLVTLFAAFRRRLPRIWLGIGGVNGLILLLHWRLEGMRHQLVGSYLITLLLLSYTVLQTLRRRAPRRVPRWLKAITIGSGFLLLTVTAVWAYAFPVFTLPPPTGSDAVGVQYLELVNETRPDPFLAGSTQPRQLLVKVNYPAKPDASAPFATYFHGSTRLMRAFAAFYGLPNFMFDHFTLVYTHAKAALALADTAATYPVILFSHGAGTSLEVSTAQTEDLASHGYIVVALDHPYVSAATDLATGLVTAHEATTNFDVPEPAKPITQLMAADVQFVLATLAQINAGARLPGFQGRLDLDRIGIIGHSVGGAVAYNLAVNDRRIKAAINLDGAVYVMPPAPTAIAPFLMLTNDKYHLQAIVNGEPLLPKLDATPAGEAAMVAMYGSPARYATAYADAQQASDGLTAVLKQSGTLYTISGSDHMKFTDIGLYIGSEWLRNILQIGGTTDPARCLEIAQALTVAFFDQQFKEQPSTTLAALPQRYPELRQVSP